MSWVQATFAFDVISADFLFNCRIENSGHAFSNQSAIKLYVEPPDKTAARRETQCFPIGHKVLSVGS